MIDFITLARKEILNFFKIWKQTIVPSVVTAILYILIFGKFLGGQILPIHGIPYINFVFPGLLLMSVIMGSYSITSFGLFGAKMFRSIEEILVSPMSTNRIIWGYLMAGLVRGVVVGTVVFVASCFFIDLWIEDLLLFFVFISLTSLTFGLLGLLNAIFAKNFDDVNFVPNFILTPMIYLGGVFYSVENLSPFWQIFSQVNPVFYMINGLRFSIIGISDVSLWLSLGVLGTFCVMLYGLVWYFLKKAHGMKS